MVEVWTQAFHPGQGITDGGRERGFPRDFRQPHGQPSLQVVKDWGGLGLAQFGATIRRGASGLLLDGIELGDPADGFFRDGGTL
ncbi:hypothetical protein D9M69_722190 [compost metagenome]